jgi:hypothetical protein
VALPAQGVLQRRGVVNIEMSFPPKQESPPCVVVAQYKLRVISAQKKEHGVVDRCSA